MDKKIIFLIVFSIFIFGIRLVNLNEAIYDDESNFAYSLTVMDKFGFNYDFSSPQPFNLLYKPLLSLFGLQTWVFRLIPWLFGILNTLLVYWLARRNWGDRAAFFSALLMLISFYPTLASLQFDVEGSLVMFCFIALFFCYLEQEKSVTPKAQLIWRLLAGAALGVAIILKYNSVYIVPVLFVYAWMSNHWRMKETIKSLLPVFGLGLALFTAHLLLATLIVPIEQQENSIAFYSWYGGFIAKYRPEGVSPLGLIMFILWSTPLFLGFYVISWWKVERRARVFLLWISGALLFYSFVLTYGALDRYFMNTIPAMALLGGITISHVSLGRRHWLFIAAGSIFYALLLFAINPFMKVVPRLPSDYFSELKHFNVAFLFSYTSSSGPTFGVSFTTIFITFLLSFLFLGWYIFHRWNEKSKEERWGEKNRPGISSPKSQVNYRLYHSPATIFAFFLAISIGFNLFLVAEYLFHPTGADVSAVKYQMLSYVRERGLPFPLYSNDAGLMWYLDHHQWKTRSDPKGLVLGIPDNELGSDVSLITQSIEKRGGSVLLLHWPPLPEQSPVFEVTRLCSLTQQFYSQEKLIGEIYRC